MNRHNEWRLNRMLSYYIMVLAYALFILKINRIEVPQWISDVVAATAIIIVTSVILFYIGHGLPYAQEFYTKMLGFDVNVYTAIAIDTFLHYLPAVILGLPKHPYSFVLAYIVILVWYLGTMHHGAVIYDHVLKSLMDRTIFTVLPIFCILMTYIVLML